MQVELLPENYELGVKKTLRSKDFETKLDQCIKIISEKEGFIEYKIDKRCISTNGGNYLGMLYEIDVSGKTKDGNKELNIFVKNIIDMEFLEILSITDVYNTEMFAYKELSKIFAELQDDAHVPMKERYKMVKVYDECNSEAIILENIAKNGFTTCNRLDVMSLEFLQLSVKHLAKFHGLSFVLKEKRPEYFNQKIKTLKHAFIFKADWKEMVKNMRDTALANVDEKYKDMLTKAFEDTAVKYAQYVTDGAIKVCLCHGDYRPNNIMVKMNDDKIQDIMPVDYQLMYFGSPIFDFLYLIYTCTNRDFRKTHISNLKELYYDSLSDFLEYFDLEADVVYPRRDFEKVFKEKRDFGLMSALLFLPFILASVEDVPDMTKEVSEISFQMDNSFKDRFEGVIKDCIELGFM